MESLVAIINHQKSSNIVAKLSILDVWWSLGYIVVLHFYYTSYILSQKAQIKITAIQKPIMHLLW